jgi:CDP-diglyceride synthetase
MERGSRHGLRYWIALSLLLAVWTLLEWLVAKLLNYLETSTIGTLIFIQGHTTLTVKENVL